MGRTGSHRNAMLANLVSSLIRHHRVTTTLAKAKAARPVAEKMVTLGKSGTIHDRRLAAARLRHHSRHFLKTKAQVEQARKTDVIRILFDEIAPGFKQRPGGYTRIMKLHRRQGDAAEMAIIEWVESAAGSDRQASPQESETSAPRAAVTEDKSESKSE